MLIFHLSDFHFEHKRTPTPYILTNLQTYFLNELNKRKNNTSLILITGDLFHNLISLNNVQVTTIIGFFIKLCDICKKNNITVRLLKGTHTHDRFQLTSLKFLEKLYSTTVFNIRSNLSVEYIKSLNKYIGYIPDNLPYKNGEEVLDTLESLLLKQYGVATLDYCCIHGVVDKYGEQIRLPNTTVQYRYDRLARLTKEWILCGHLHIPYKYKKLLYAGSFDRLAHGEESKKGYWIIDTEQNEPTFIENKNAMFYKSISLLKLGIKSQNTAWKIEYIKKELSKFFSKRDVGYIRIICLKEEIFDIKSNINSYLQINAEYQQKKIRIRYERDKNEQLIKDNESLWKDTDDDNDEEKYEEINESTIARLLYALLPIREKFKDIGKLEEILFKY